MFAGNRTRLDCFETDGVSGATLSLRWLDVFSFVRRCRCVHSVYVVQRCTLRSPVVLFCEMLPLHPFIRLDIFVELKETPYCSLLVLLMEA